MQTNRQTDDGRTVDACSIVVARQLAAFYRSTVNWRIRTRELSGYPRTPYIARKYLLWRTFLGVFSFVFMQSSLRMRHKNLAKPTMETF